MYHGGWYPFAGGWLVGLLVVAAFVVLIAWGVAWILRRDTHHYGAPPPPRSDPAIEILRERFARGEISEADYLAASRVLGAPGPPASSPTDRSQGSPPV